MRGRRCGHGHGGCGRGRCGRRHQGAAVPQPAARWAAHEGGGAGEVEGRGVQGVCREGALCATNATCRQDSSNDGGGRATSASVLRQRAGGRGCSSSGDAGNCDGPKLAADAGGAVWVCLQAQVLNHIGRVGATWHECMRPCRLRAGTKRPREDNSQGPGQPAQGPSGAAAGAGASGNARSRVGSTGGVVVGGQGAAEPKSVIMVGLLGSGWPCPCAAAASVLCAPPPAFTHPYTCTCTITARNIFR